jgi:hypothetical protein
MTETQCKFHRTLIVLFLRRTNSDQHYLYDYFDTFSSIRSYTLKRFLKSKLYGLSKDTGQVLRRLQFAIRIREINILFRNLLSNHLYQIQHKRKIKVLIKNKHNC